MSGLQSPRVQRVPGVPEADPRLEVHRVLRGQVRMGGAGGVGGAYEDGRGRRWVGGVVGQGWLESLGYGPGPTINKDSCHSLNLIGKYSENA